jgi:hypothetical protein
MFATSIKSVIGDGASTLFCTDRWIQGKSIVDLAPDLGVAVSRRLLKRRTVQEALSNGSWVHDVRNNLSDRALFQLIYIWVTVQEFQLAAGVPDHHMWTPSSSGTYSSKSAYDHFFIGAVGFELVYRIWRSWAPSRCKFFHWLAALNRCWTADRLARRGWNLRITARCVTKRRRPFNISWFPVCLQGRSGLGCCP